MSTYQQICEEQYLELQKAKKELKESKEFICKLVKCLRAYHVSELAPDFIKDNKELIDRFTETDKTEPDLSK